MRTKTERQVEKYPQDDSLATKLKFVSRGRVFHKVIHNLSPNATYSSQDVIMILQKPT